METIIIQTENSKTKKGLVAFLKAFDIPFSIKKEKENPYDPKFVAKIERSREQAKEGKVYRIKTEDLWK